MLILEFENIWESDLVAALHRALDVARMNDSDLAPRIRMLLDEAEANETESLKIKLQ